MDPIQKIKRIKQQILSLGPMLPGSISAQWNVCGVAGCRCKDRDNPKKHGPYYQLSFSVKGKSSSMFIQKDALIEARRRIKRYKTFKQLSFDLIQAYVDLARNSGINKEDSI